MRVVSRAVATGLSVALLCSFAHAQSKSASHVELEQLKSQLQNIRQGFPGDMAVYVKNLKTGEEIALDADSIYETFSVIKVPIMAAVLRQAEAGKFSLNDRITLRAADQRLPSGVLYTMQPGLNPTIRDLITLMIIISDNAATDLLADKVGRANVTSYMHELGLKDTSIRFSDLDWDRTWLGTLDRATKMRPGTKPSNFHSTSFLKPKSSPHSTKPSTMPEFTLATALRVKSVACLK